MKQTKTLEIDAYVLPKVKGTRFVGHRLNAVKVLLHNWYALGRSFKKEIVTRSHSDPVRSKLIRYLKELNDYRMRASAVMFKKILSICRNLQYQFEDGKILAFEIPEKIDNVIDDLQELIEKYNRSENEDKDKVETCEQRDKIEFTSGEDLVDEDDCAKDAENERLGNCILRISYNDEVVMYQSLPKAEHLREKICLPRVR